MLDNYRIENLEQVRLLSNPLKLKLIQLLAERARTARELAEELGENVTRLYRHVDALHDAGLIEVVRETPKRGTVERTFRAVAKRFEVDHALFTGGDESTSAIRTHLRGAEAELLAALRESGEDVPVFMRLRIKASPERLREFRERLLQWAEELQALEDCAEDEATEAGALIAFYPIVPGR